MVSHARLNPGLFDYKTHSAGITRYPYAKVEGGGLNFDPYLTPYLNVKSKWIMNRKLRTEALKLLNFLKKLWNKTFVTIG